MDLDQWLKTKNKQLDDVEIELDGYYFKGDPFSIKIRLKSFPITHLIEDSMHAYRVYEFINIKRPADVLKYIWIEIIQLPKYFQNKYESIIDKKNYRFTSSPDWPEGFIPFNEFDRFSEWFGDDTEREAECWLLFREGEGFTEFCSTLFEEVLLHQGKLRENTDVIIQEELRLIDSHSHRYDYVQTPSCELTKPNYETITKPKYSRQYYIKLRELLNQESISSVSYRYPIDYQTVKLFCDQQIVRRNEKSENAFEINILDDPKEKLSGWGCIINWYFEGLCIGDLHVEQSIIDSELLQKYIGSNSMSPICFLHLEDVGDFQNYRKNIGCAWVLYTQKALE